MPILTTDFSSLTDDLQEIFNEVSRTKVSQSVGLKLFGVKDTNRKTYDHLLLHGVDGVEEVTEGQDLPLVNSDEGDTITYTQRYFGARFAVTKQMRKFDLYDQIESLARSVTTRSWDKVEQSFADVLLYGWSTSYTDVFGGTTTSTGPDGLALFNASHTNGVSTSSQTFSNIISDGTSNNPALSRAALVNVRKQGLTYKDPAGIIRPVNIDTLLVAPSNEDLAHRLIESEGIVGSANREVNPLRGKFRVVVWPHLETRSDSTDTSAYWFAYDSSMVGESLKALFAERPTLDPPEQVYKNKNWEYTIDFYYTVGLGWPAYVFGSQGTA